ncbi:flagellar filament capping protein FliD [Massilia sp. H6]|uniref:flagellar filament capping protein FliD n=1 Tax=Massilia sp. H6 TaxID=2970464 RepID=UPI0021672AB0|nr:flagellar filament capping protein FliD [Massilia sp. H6]UVW27876.1 flagellar filament capping protein FliD [Massilia sp. H6]
MGISSSGIGSGLDVSGIIGKLMQAEAAPLASFDKKAAVLQTRIGALGKVSAAVGSFQGALTSLNSPATFNALNTSSANKEVLAASAGTGAVPGKYNISVSQLASAQSLSTAGRASMSAIIGTAAKTTLTFQFGSIGGGSFGVAGTALGASTTNGGISNGSLSVNGTVITTSAATRSAAQLAEAINAKSETTGVTAKAGAATSAANLFASFGPVTTAASASYTLSVGGVSIASQAGTGATLDAAGVDDALAGGTVSAALAAANITFTGSAAAGDLQFTAADGSNLTVLEAIGGSGSVTGGIGGAGVDNTGSSVTTTAGVTLNSRDGNQIMVGGTNPAAAGLVAGSAGSYLDGAAFAQDGAQSSGTVTLEAGEQSLQGMRDAINKANIGVTATIVSDGGDNPYHLVLTSNKTGAKSSMKIGVDGADGGAPNAAIAALLGHDPGGVQGLTQTSAAQDTLLNMNGIDIRSSGTTVTDAVQGVSLDITGIGSTSLNVTRDTAAASTAVNNFVKAYNELNKTISGLTGYNAETKTAGALQGDSSVRSIQSQLRRQLGGAVEGLGGKLTTLGQVGITFQKDGSLAVDSSKLNKAINDNYAEIGGLFAAVGSATDGMVKFDKSTGATKPGSYGVNITSLATQGTLTGAAALAGPTTIAPNTTWRITLNQTDPVSENKTQDIALAAGTYTDAQLVAMLRAAVNGNTVFAGAGDTVETKVDDNGRISISSSKYGSTSNLAVASLSGSDPGIVFGSATPEVGKDIEGTIGGVAATGNGQALTAAAGSPADGIQLSITGGLVGERGTVNFSKGFAFELTNLATGFVGKDSLLSGKTDGLNISLKSIATARNQFSARLETIEKRYRAQFTALDSALMSMQSTSAYLTQQLATLSANSRS